MGQEIAFSEFTKDQFDNFYLKLSKETQQLRHLLSHIKSSPSPHKIGLEIEAWLLRSNMAPACINEYYLDALNDPLVNAELAKFNIEFNTHPIELKGHVFSSLQDQVQQTWSHATQVAQQHEAELMMIGILPTLSPNELVIENMSHLNRYRALNEQILKARDEPVHIDISGHEHLKMDHHDVMLESAATSLQIHTQVPYESAHHFYNASMIASAAMVSIAGNAPFLFGKRLWHETRIPLFEQSIEIGGYSGASHGPVKRVSFGTDYARKDIFECFTENLEHYPVLLPVELSEPENALAHLRLHNGTIWRWNRPLVGFDDQGQIHIRIEHRTPAAGPTVVDTLANAAFFTGLCHAYYQELLLNPPPLSFPEVRDNFYKAARFGLDAHIQDDKGNTQRLQKLILDQYLNLAFDALLDLGVESKSATHYLTIIENRVKLHQTGSDWQIAFIDKYGADFTQLTKVYLYNQQRGIEVAEWPI